MLVLLIWFLVERALIWFEVEADWDAWVDDCTIGTVE